MPDQFADALERLDVVFEDFESMDGLINRLHGVLQRMPSTLQVEVAIEKFQRERQIATDLGFTIDRFIRRGQPITQLRDRFGRFVAVGAEAISRRLEQEAG